MITSPGNGWTHLGSAVYEHTSGLRVHTQGLLRFPSGETKTGSVWPESKTLEKFVRICGGSRKRGVMVWALNSAPSRGVGETDAN